MGAGRGAFAGGRGSSRPSPWDAIDRSAQPCVFFAQEMCTKGDSCPFSHAAAGSGNDSNGQRISQESDTSHTLPRGDTLAVRVQTQADTNVVSVAETPHGEKHLNQVLDSAQTGNGLPNQDGVVGSVSSSGGPPLVKGSDGAMYVIGPDGPVALDAVVRTMGVGRGTSAAPPDLPKQSALPEKRESIYQGTSDQRRASGILRPAQETAKKSDNALVLNTPDRAPTQGGVIALADGGFITRKRAAEMQLRDDSSDRRVRQIRQREVGDQEKSREHQGGVPETRSVATGSSRGSIMDRLGPARPTQGRTPIADRATAPARLARPTQGRIPPTVRAGALGPARQQHIGVPTAEKAPNPVRIRTEAGKREEKRQHNAPPPDRVKISSQTFVSSALSIPQVLGTTRQTQRSGGGRGDGGSVIKGLGTSTPTSKSSALDFKVPTLDEIKSRKAKAARGTVKATIVTPQDKTREKPEGRSMEEKSDMARKDMESPAQGPSSPAPPLPGVTMPSPGAAAPPIEPQLHAADMDEFSEWL